MALAIIRQRHEDHVDVVVAHVLGGASCLAQVGKSLDRSTDPVHVPVFEEADQLAGRGLLEVARQRARGFVHEHDHGGPAMYGVRQEAARRGDGELMQDEQRERGRDESEQQHSAREVLGILGDVAD